jgi:hypothetical protein
MNWWLDYFAAAVLCVLLANAAPAQPPTDEPKKDAAPTPSAPVPPIPTESLNSLSSVLKNIVLQQLPASPSFQTAHNWGHQAMVPTLQGLKIVHVLKNHGNWQILHAAVPDLTHNLEFRLHDLKIHDAERLTFWVYLSAPTKFDFHEQVWQNGLRILNATGRGRLRIWADIKLETLIKIDTKGSFLPDLAITFKAVDARVNYDNLVMENINGIGGDAARITGDVVHHALHRWKPSMERHVLERAREAVLKAGQSREVHVSLAKLLSK